MGRDCIHGKLREEIITLVNDAGFPPVCAIRAATAVASEACGIDAITGTIEPGKAADITGVEQNPLQDITALRRMAFVMREGRVCLYNGKTLI